jgi:hypothetical protein
MDVRRRLATPEELRQGQEEMQKAQERMQSEAGRLGEDPIEDVKATEDSKVGEEKTVVEVGRAGMVGESIPISTPPSGSLQNFFPSNAFMASARSFNTLYDIAKAVIAN